MQLLLVILFSFFFYVPVYTQDVDAQKSADAAVEADEDSVIDENKDTLQDDASNADSDSEKKDTQEAAEDSSDDADEENDDSAVDVDDDATNDDPKENDIDSASDDDSDDDSDDEKKQEDIQKDDESDDDDDDESEDDESEVESKDDFEDGEQEESSDDKKKQKDEPDESANELTDESSKQEPSEHEVASLEDIPSEEDEEYGIDTLALQDPSGNWLYKRIWWEKAEARYDKIKAAVNQVLDGRMYFFEQRVNLDRTLFDPFYKTLGFSRGELQEAVSLLIEQLQDANAKSDTKKIERKAAINALQEEQESIEKLQKDVDAIRDIDHTIDDALTKLMNQINACRHYEQEGWQYLRSISREVSDKVARDHYYAMDTVWKNVKNVQKYIEGEFAQHFNELVADAKKRTEAITQVVAQLKEKGLDLKNIATKALKSEADSEDQDMDDSDDEDDAGSVGWMQWILDILLWPFKKIADFWGIIFG